MSGADTADLEDEYTDDGGILWGKLSRGLVGVFLTLVGFGVASVIGLFRDGVTGLLDGIGSFWAMLIGAPFQVGSGQLTRATEAATSGLAILGPAAFPVAVILSIATTTLILWGVSRFV
jgi:VIT1/CCC1 family predicted Fe2+/Mn2+ transporter